MIFIGLLLTLLVFGGIVTLVVLGLRGKLGGDDEHAGGEVGIGSVRRTFLYGLAFAALVLGASGITSLLAQLLDSWFGAVLLRDDAGRAAFGIAATVVAVPIWLLLRRATERSVEEYPEERGTLGRKLHAYLVLGLSAALLGRALIELLQGAFTPAQFDPGSIAPVLAWAAVWWVHWQWEKEEGQPSARARGVRGGYLNLASTVSLVLLAVGVGAILMRAFTSAYDGVMGGRLMTSGVGGFWDSSLRDALAVGVVGALGWGFHWFRTSTSALTPGLRSLVLYLVGIFGGLVTAVIGGAAILQTGLEWFFAAPSSVSAALHFDLVPGALAALSVGIALWYYHSQVVREEAGGGGGAGSGAGSGAEGGPSAAAVVPAERGYHYLAAAVGLLTLGFGLTTLIGVAVGLVVRGAEADLTITRWWAPPLSLALTLIAVGAPLWWSFWSRRQEAAGAGVEGERDAGTRRVFVFGVFGLAILSTLAGLSTFLVLLLRPLLEGTFGMDALDDGKWALGVVLTAGTISYYYWSVLQEDREEEEANASTEAARAEANAPPLPFAITVLAPPEAGAIIDALAQRLGVRPRVWWRLDGDRLPATGDEEAAAAIARALPAIEELRADGVGEILLLIEGGALRVVPFRSGS